MCFFYYLRPGPEWENINRCKFKTKNIFLILPKPGNTQFFAKIVITRCFLWVPECIHNSKLTNSTYNRDETLNIFLPFFSSLKHPICVRWGGKTQNWDTSSCRVETATGWHLPALFMAGRAPFRAQRRFPPKGTYCWLRGKLSVFRSCRRCFSLKMEWTVFRKSFLASGELRQIKGHIISLSLCR